MKPVCIPCKRFFKVIKSGYTFIEGMPTEHPALPGKAEPEKWIPYKLWSGDLWECQGCGTQIISGVGLCPISVQHSKDFKGFVEKYGAKFQVNDC